MKQKKRRIDLRQFGYASDCSEEIFKKFIPAQAIRNKKPFDRILGIIEIINRSNRCQKKVEVISAIDLYK